MTRIFVSMAASAVMRIYSAKRKMPSGRVRRPCLLHYSSVILNLIQNLIFICHSCGGRNPFSYCHSQRFRAGEESVAATSMRKRLSSTARNLPSLVSRLVWESISASNPSRIFPLSLPGERMRTSEHSEAPGRLHETLSSTARKYPKPKQG